MTPFAEPVPSVQGGHQGDYIGHMTRWLSNLSGHKRRNKNMDVKMRLKLPRVAGTTKLRDRAATGLDCRSDPADAGTPRTI